MDAYKLVVFGSLLIAICTGFLFFALGKKEEKNIRSVLDFIQYGYKATNKELRLSFYATNVSLASIFITLAGLSSKQGLVICWSAFAWIAGIWCFYFFYKSQEIQKFFGSGGRSLFGFLGKTYKSDSVRKLSALISIVPYVGSVGIEFYAFVLILRVLGLSETMIIPVCVLLTLITVAYATISGFRGVIKTESCQLYTVGIGCLALIAAIVIGIMKPGNDINFQKETFDFFAAPMGLFGSPDVIVGFILIFLPFTICSMDMWQRCAAINNNNGSSTVKEVKKMVMTGSFVFLGFYSIPIGCGILYWFMVAGQSTPLSEGAPLIIPILNSISELNIGMQILLLGGSLSAFVAAMISTADTLLMSSISALFFDFFRAEDKGDLNLETLKASEHAQLIAKARVWMIILGLISLTIALVAAYGVGVITFLWTLFSSLIILAPVLIIPVFFPKFADGKNVSAYGSIASGFLMVVSYLVFCLYSAGQEQAKELASAAPIIGFAVSLIMFFVLIPLNKKLPQEN